MIFSAMTFTRKDVFVNPARISPALVEIHLTTHGSGTFRLCLGKKPAICVSPGMCTESMIIAAAKTNQTPPRDFKYVSLMLHNQEWERWESFMCFCFGHDMMHASITNSALQISSMLSKADKSGGKYSDNSLLHRSWHCSHFVAGKYGAP